MRQSSACSKLREVELLHARPNHLTIAFELSQMGYLTVGPFSGQVQLLLHEARAPGALTGLLLKLALGCRELLLHLPGC